MSSQGLILGIVIFFVVLVVLGLLGRRARKEPTLSDHFLAGRGLGFTVLLLTLFATQYSGNSLSGFPGKTYREGRDLFHECHVHGRDRCRVPAVRTRTVPPCTKKEVPDTGRFPA